MDRITVTVMKWEKYNPRRDIKHPSWFALSNRLLEDPDLFDFDPLEFKAYLYILCQASQRNSPTVTINFTHADRVSNVTRKWLLSSVEKLSRIGALAIIEDPRTDHERARTESERDTTDRQTDTTDKTRHTEPLFDFTAAFELFPGKVKGTNAEKRFRDQIKSESDYADLMAALKHYRAMLALPENEWRRPKTSFEIFLGTAASGFFWRQFIDPGSAEPVKKGGGREDMVAQKLREHEEWQKRKKEIYGEVGQ